MDRGIKGLLTELLQVRRVLAFTMVLLGAIIISNESSIVEMFERATGLNSNVPGILMLACGAGLGLDIDTHFFPLLVVPLFIYLFMAIVAMVMQPSLANGAVHGGALCAIAIGEMLHPTIRLKTR